LHQYSRERDENGTVIANLRDYEIVRELVGGVVTQEAGVGVANIVRETRQAIDALLAGGRSREVNVKQVARDCIGFANSRL